MGRDGRGERERGVRQVSRQKTRYDTSRQKEEYRYRACECVKMIKMHTAIEVRNKRRATSDEEESETKKRLNRSKRSILQTEQKKAVQRCLEDYGARRTTTITTTKHRPRKSHISEMLWYPNTKEYFYATYADHIHPIENMLYFGLAVYAYCIQSYQSNPKNIT